ncbi:DNA-binding GntR family transcriptional regulator [Clostridium saccharoperbutylacetonicum]|uniref:Regulatory protein GntR, HTH n=1 Tax=Clostridium saccharoperbutylacetonicum N1-4(HMT) TaxID=931276 RepID=M1N4Q7_9CLOT|nr:GntR family transcriptional regulator [Clostridium saccharoperbutylacetonicum]AGF58437.1 regulatory protein GntR, HTH [Clostridium saccharoperbutylacetonicum N1-4(HMT)]NRT60785.1 DNA-binding GntR family transcriptional regulator [Clostridium saccharoperbutylacetonicum]NSB24099.1 DNA-binding GntR family transcriptional regulator [Clostridium saccharoperbutylacetonicum]NSB43477.1 DNA-binding GntR family transcriptional regulator [Clostridium saccharoperbutylacetonicum]
MNEFNITVNEKELRYVSVYNQLFKMINEGTFPEGSRLPSEPELSKLIGVSRTTLRQALALLQDDGLVNNIRGKGNFIVKAKPKKDIGLETMGHPIYKCINDTIDEVKIQLRIEPSTDYFNQILIKKTAAVVLIDRWYKAQGKSIAYTFTLLPIETISKFNLDLNNQDQILEFIETELYEISSDILVEIKYSTSGNFAAKAYPISPENQFHLIQETIHKDSEFPIASNKHYLPIKTSSIKFHPKK